MRNSIDKVLLAPGDVADLIAAKDARIQELLEANNRYQQEGRDARARVRILNMVLGGSISLLQSGADKSFEDYQNANKLQSDNKLGFACGAEAMRNQVASFVNNYLGEDEDNPNANDALALLK